MAGREIAAKFLTLLSKLFLLSTGCKQGQLFRLSHLKPVESHLEIDIYAVRVSENEAQSI